jgi:hypothetical protein
MTAVANAAIRSFCLRSIIYSRCGFCSSLRFAVANPEKRLLNRTRVEPAMLLSVPR